LVAFHRGVGEEHAVAARAGREEHREPPLRRLVEAQPDGGAVNLEAPVVPEDERPHGANAARPAALVAEHRAEPVEQPATGGKREARPFAGRRIADLERGAREPRIVAAARERRHEAIAGLEDEALALRGLAQREALSREELRLRARRRRRSPARPPAPAGRRT
jgi:hypothetical protein